MSSSANRRRGDYAVFTDASGAVVQNGWTLPQLGTEAIDPATDIVTPAPGRDRHRKTAERLAERVVVSHRYPG